MSVHEGVDHWTRTARHCREFAKLGSSVASMIGLVPDVFDRAATALGEAIADNERLRVALEQAQADAEVWRWLSAAANHRDRLTNPVVAAAFEVHRRAVERSSTPTPRDPQQGEPCLAVDYDGLRVTAEQVQAAITSMNRNLTRPLPSSQGDPQ